MVKTHKDYLERLQVLYPTVPVPVLEKVILKGVSALQGLIRSDHDIRLENLHCSFDQYRLIMYRSKGTPPEKKKRYFVNIIRLKTLRQAKRERYEKRIQSK